MKKNQGPFVTVGAHRQFVANAQSAMMASTSGQFSADQAGVVAGILTAPADVTKVLFALGKCGRDATDALYVEADVLIDGTSVLTTKPKILANSGEKRDSLDTGQTEAVIDTANNRGYEGSLIQVNFEMTKTTPDENPYSPVVLIELQPIK